MSFKTHQIPLSTLQALEEAKQRGIYIFISTGRPKVLITVLGEMEKRGLIERKRLNSDKRAYAIYIKDKARPVFEAVQRVFEEVLKLSLEGFSDEEAAEFEKYLERMENNLKNT